MTGCDCAACRARDARRFARIIEANYPDGPATLAERVAPHGHPHSPKLGLPPIPEWVGEPTEYKGEEL